MKKIIFFIILFFAFGNCQNQKKRTQENQSKKSPISIQPMDNIPSVDYFIGKWKVYDKVMFTRYTSKKQKIALKPCNEYSYWEFKRNSKKVVQTKVTAVKNCQSFVRTKPGIVNYQGGGTLSYFVDDVYFSIKAEKIDENKFFITQQETISGKNIIIRTFYQRK